MELNLDQESPDHRVEILNSILRHAVRTLFTRCFDVNRAKAAFSQFEATSQFMQGIRDSAAKSQKDGAVAESLVGAKLALWLPDKEISNKS